MCRLVIKPFPDTALGVTNEFALMCNANNLFITCIKQLQLQVMFDYQIVWNFNRNHLKMKFKLKKEHCINLPKEFQLLEIFRICNWHQYSI